MILRHKYTSSPATPGFHSKSIFEPTTFQREVLLSDARAYRETLETLRDPKKRVDTNRCEDRHFESGEAGRVFDSALEAYLRGPKQFKDFKFSPEFHKELSSLYGGERGQKIFDSWKADTRYLFRRDEVNYIISETGDFHDLFYGGRVKDTPNCQDPSGTSVHVAAITGTVELPWIKQMVVRAEGSPEILFRARIYLVHDASGAGPILLIQPRYYGTWFKDAIAISKEIERHLRSKYEVPQGDGGPGIEVKLMPNRMISHDVGINTGYATYSSGRSPFFYIDSNCHVWRMGDIVFASNGLYSKDPGSSVSFMPGWSSEYTI